MNKLVLGAVAVGVIPPLCLAGVAVGMFLGWSVAALATFAVWAVGVGLLLLVLGDEARAAGVRIGLLAAGAALLLAAACCVAAVPFVPTYRFQSARSAVVEIRSGLPRGERLALQVSTGAEPKSLPIRPGVSETTLLVPTAGYWTLTGTEEWTTDRPRVAVQGISSAAARASSIRLKRVGEDRWLIEVAPGE